MSKNGLLTLLPGGKIVDMDSRYCDICGWGDRIVEKDREGYDFCYRHKEEVKIVFISQGNLFRYPDNGLKI